MEARHFLKQLKDEGWYLGDTEGASRQYVHPERPGVITVCVRYTDVLGPDTVAAVSRPAEADTSSDPHVAVESSATGVSAYSPDLSGCAATGTDEDEARARMAEAMALHRRRLATARPGADRA